MTLIVVISHFKARKDALRSENNEKILNILNIYHNDAATNQSFWK